MPVDAPRSEAAGATEQPPAGLAGTVVRGVGLAGAGYVLTQGLTLVSYFVLAKLATPQEFGRFTAATVVAGLGLVIGESGMLGALIQRRDRLDEAFNTAFVATLASGLLLTLLALASAPLIGLFFHSSQTGVVAAVMSGWIFLRLAAIVPDARLQRSFSFFRRVIIDPLAAIAFAAGAIAAAAAGLGVWALVIGTYASALVQTGSSWWLGRWRPQPRLASFSMWRELARYGRPVVISEFVRRVANQAPVVALGRFAGAGPLGQFTYASRVATRAPAAITNVGSYVLLPAFARLSAHDDRYRPAFLRALRWMCAIAFPAGLIFVPLGLPAVVVIFGEPWRDAGYGAMALAGYCATASLASIAAEAWKASGRTDLLPRMHGLALALTLVLVVALLPFGLVGVCAALSLASIGVGVYAVRGAAHVVGLPVKRLIAEIWPPAVAALVMAGGVYALERGLVHADRHGGAAGLALLVGETVIAVAVYLAAMAVVAPGTTRELVRALARLRSRRSGRAAA